MLLAAPLLAALVQPVGPTDSVLIFRDACLEGKASLAAGSVKRIETNEIPPQARSLLKNINNGGIFRGRKAKFDLSKIPTSSFSINNPGDQSFLIVPDPDAESGPKSLCVVFVRGDRYVESLRMMSEYTGYGSIGEAEGYRDQLSHTAYAGEYNVTSARGDGWTMISAIRVPTSPEEKKE